MERKTCADCPWNDQSPFSDIKHKVIPIIEKDLASGVLVGPHACHTITENWVPTSKNEECLGHRRHLESKE